MTEFQNVTPQGPDLRGPKCVRGCSTVHEPVMKHCHERTDLVVVNIPECTHDRRYSRYEKRACDTRNAFNARSVTSKRAARCKHDHAHVPER